MENQRIAEEILETIAMETNSDLIDTYLSYKKMISKAEKKLAETIEHIGDSQEICNALESKILEKFYPLAVMNAKIEGKEQENDTVAKTIAICNDVKKTVTNNIDNPVYNCIDVYMLKTKEKDVFNEIKDKRNRRTINKILKLLLIANISYYNCLLASQRIINELTRNKALDVAIESLNDKEIDFFGKKKACKKFVDYGFGTSADEAAKIKWLKQMKDVIRQLSLNYSFKK